MRLPRGVTRSMGESGDRNGTSMPLGILTAVPPSYARLTYSSKNSSMDMSAP